MENQTGFIVKVFVFSALLSLLIRYVGPGLGIGGTTTNILIMVLSPSLIMAIALLWRLPSKREGDRESS
jgi:small basic protein